MAKKQKNKNYKLRSKVYKGIGTSATFATTIGGFVAYESAINWNNFKTDLENFVVINESVKLNLAIALPALIAIIVFIWIYRKKNEEALKGKVAFSLLFGVVVLWLVYSIIEATLMAMIGGFVGAVFDELIFTPLSQSAKRKADDDHEVSLEIRKERVRQKVRDEIDGTV